MTAFKEILADIIHSVNYGYKRHQIERTTEYKILRKAWAAFDKARPTFAPRYPDDRPVPDILFATYSSVFDHTPVLKRMQQERDCTHCFTNTYYYVENFWALDNTTSRVVFRKITITQAGNNDYDYE